MPTRGQGMYVVFYESEIGDGEHITKTGRNTPEEAFFLAGMIVARRYVDVSIEISDIPVTWYESTVVSFYARDTDPVRDALIWIRYVVE